MPDEPSLLVCTPCTSPVSPPFPSMYVCFPCGMTVCVSAMCRLLFVLRMCFAVKVVCLTDCKVCFDYLIIAFINPLGTIPNRTYITIRSSAKHDRLMYFASLCANRTKNGGRKLPDVKHECYAKLSVKSFLKCVHCSIFIFSNPAV